MSWATRELCRTAVLTAVSTVVMGARAQETSEPRLPIEPRVMREPGEVVDVADAFEDDDVLDVHVGLSFELEIRSSTIAREQGEGSTKPVAKYSSFVSRLVPRLAVGLYEDLAVIVRLPISLSDSSELTPRSAASSGTILVENETLARLPFRSPERSGLEYAALGVDWGIFNQARRSDFPTWVLGAEVRVSIGTPKRACNEEPPEGQVQCTGSEDIDRNGRRDAGEESSDPSIDSGGITRGTLGLELHTALSRRIRYIEPYGTAAVLVEIPVGESLFDETTRGDGETMPPVRAEVGLGTLVIPWENRERFSRVTLDLRAVGAVATRGLDYAELFDAIGSSAAPSVRAPSPSPGGNLYSTGLQVVEPHLAVGGRTGATWQASELVKLSFAVDARYETPHGITHTEEGPSVFPILHTPGQRFVVEDALAIDIAAQGVVMF